MLAVTSDLTVLAVDAGGDGSLDAFGSDHVQLLSL
jgi:hypothetical protein